MDTKRRSSILFTVVIKTEQGLDFHVKVTLHTHIRKSLSNTLSGISELSTHHSGIITTPGVITHCAPHISTNTDLHSPFIWNVASCQLQLTSCTWCYIKIYCNIEPFSLYYNKVEIPLHPTPASAECGQLCVKIGWLEHSSS